MISRFDRYMTALIGRPRGRRSKKRPAQIRRGFRSLRLEQLEDRRLLTITVNTLVDENNGIGVGAGTSLREALFAVGVNETINFSVTGMINLSNLGQISINKGAIIDGPGAALLTINAYDPTPATNNGDGSRVFSISDGNANTQFSIEIKGVTLSGGDVSGFGGAILNSENLTLRECLVVDNAALGSESQRRGGGIYQTAGDLTVVDSTIRNNSAGQQGGGVFISTGNLTMLRSTIRDNLAPDGGGILSAGNVVIRDSTVSINRGTDGAGITHLQGEMMVENSTISGNIATRDGGGIRSVQGNLTVRHSTLTNNAAESDDNGLGRGGGIFVGNSVVTLDHVLVAGNTRRVSIREDIFGRVSAIYTLVGDGSGATIVNNGLNMVGNSTVPVVPLLGPLADNGGPTMTHALLPGSPAIDLGDPYAMAGAEGISIYDQRNESFGRVTDGNGQNGARIDIGAYEFQSGGTLPALLGDYNGDGKVDTADYCVWRDTFGQVDVSPFSGADGDGNGSIGPADYIIWKANFGNSLPVGGMGSVVQESVFTEQVTTSIAFAQELPSLVSVAIVDQVTAQNLRLPIRSQANSENGVLSLADDSREDRGLLAWLTSHDCYETEPEDAQRQGDPTMEVTPLSAGVFDEGFASLIEPTSQVTNCLIRNGAFQLPG